jgi:dTDP-4-dehydrorhamnose 3,5-epimerase
MMPFAFQPMEIPEVILVEAKAFEDHRGFFMEAYRSDDFAEGGIPERFVQDNFSHSLRGVLRGLHYQRAPAAQGKLVMAIRGEIFDVAVDLRRGSRTYGSWVAAELSGENHRMLYVPEGFAHGFCVLSEEADVVYKVTADYSPEDDRGILWNDPDLGIPWPVGDPVLSAKDQALPPLHSADINFDYQ